MIRAAHEKDKAHSQATGLEHARSITAIALRCQHLGDQEQALELFLRALTLLKELKREHSIENTVNKLIAQTLNNTALVYDLKGQLNEALDMYMQALHSFEKQHGRDCHGIDSANVLQNLGCLFAQYNDESKLDKAYGLFRRSLRIKESVLGKDHFENAGTLQNMANVRCKQNRFKESLSIHRRAKRILDRAHSGGNGGADLLDRAAEVLMGMAAACEGLASERTASTKAVYQNAAILRDDLPLTTPFKKACTHMSLSSSVGNLDAHVGSNASLNLDTSMSMTMGMSMSMNMSMSVNERLKVVHSNNTTESNCSLGRSMNTSALLPSLNASLGCGGSSGLYSSLLLGAVNPASSATTTTTSEGNDASVAAGAAISVAARANATALPKTGIRCSRALADASDVLAASVTANQVVKSPANEYFLTIRQTLQMHACPDVTPLRVLRSEGTWTMR
jgi:hypothetical protein